MKLHIAKFLHGSMDEKISISRRLQYMTMTCINRKITGKKNKKIGRRVGFLINLLNESIWRYCVNLCWYGVDLCRCGVDLCLYFGDVDQCLYLAAATSGRRGGGGFSSNQAPSVWMFNTYFHST